MAYFSDLFSTEGDNQNKQNQFQSSSSGQQKGYFGDLNLTNSPAPQQKQPRPQQVQQQQPQQNIFQQAGNFFGNMFNQAKQAAPQVINQAKGALGGNFANDLQQKAPLEKTLGDIPLFGGLIKNTVASGFNAGQTFASENIPLIDKPGTPDLIQQKQQADTNLYNTNLQLIQKYNTTTNTSEKGRLGKLIQQNMNSTFDLPKIIPVIKKTPLQVAAEGAGVGLDVALMGGGIGHTVESAASDSFLKTLITKKSLLSGSTFGAAYGGQQSLAAGETNPQKIALNMATNAILFPAMDVAVKGIGKGVSDFTNQVFQQFSKKAVDLAEKSKNQDEMIGNLDKVIGTVQDKYGSNQEATTGIRTALQQELDSFAQKQPINELKNDPQIGKYIASLEDHIQSLGGEAKAVEKPAENTFAANAGKYQSANDFANAEFSTTPHKQIGEVDPHSIIIRDPVDKTSAEYQALKADIQKNGIQEPINIDATGKPTTVDGSQRTSIAQDLGIKVPVVVNKGEVKGLSTIEDVYNQSTKNNKESPLTQEARNYSSFNEFVKNAKDFGIDKEKARLEYEKAKLQTAQKKVIDYYDSLSSNPEPYQNKDINRAVAYNVRNNNAPQEVIDAVHLLGSPTVDHETGEILGTDHPDWPRGGTIYSIVNHEPHADKTLEDIYNSVHPQATSAIHLPEKGVYAKITPEQQDYLRQETKNIPFTAEDKPHLTPLTKLEGKAKEVSLDEVKSLSPNMKQALDTFEASNHGSVTLNAGINPGLDKFLKEDVKPQLEQVAAGAKEIKSIVNPATVSEKAAQTADIVRNAKSTIANLAGIEADKSNDYNAIFNRSGNNFHTFFNKMNDHDNIANISAYERTGKFAEEPKPGYSELYKKSMDTSHQIMQAVYGNDRVGYIENYVRRQFKFGSEADEAKGTTYLANYARSLSASKSPLQNRVLDMPLDEALKNMQDRGIKVKMTTTNPEMLRQWSLNNANRALVFADTWKQLRETNLINFVKQGDSIPEGLTKLNDRAAEVFFPSGSGLVKTGAYYADPAVARILNNTISSGLEGSATFQGLRVIENNLNQFQLGISGFHFLGTAINASISDIALGMRNLLQGNPLEAAKNISFGTVPFASFAKDVFTGRSIIEGLKDSSPEAYKFLEDKLNPAGGRLGLDERYRITAYENMQKAFANGNLVGAAIRVPSAIVEKVGQPLMEYAIPRAKLGAFSDLASNVLSRLPADASKQLKQRMLSQAWASIDNRFGQLVYDNLFWNKVGKDLAMFSTRSVGWNLGTVRELGGAIKDIPLQTLKGKGVSDRMLYAAALPIYVGFLGAAYQYLHTGQQPAELKDYFYPKNGLTDANGNPDRVSLPSYMKDVFAYAKDPIGTVLHKTSPLIDIVSNLVSNTDYYNHMIRNTNDPVGTQLSQTGSYLLKNILPFSMQQQQQLKSEGANPERQAESFVGIIPAPRSIVASDKQTKLQQVFQKQVGTQGPQTPEQVQTAQLETQARTDIKNGVPLKQSQAFMTLVQQGTIKTRKQADTFINEAKLTSNQRMFKHLSIQNKHAVLSK